jgi:hypothetical protein
MSAEGPPRGANCVPAGGSEAAIAASVGVHKRAAGPPQGRLHEWGEAQARSARPRVLAAADTRSVRCAHRPNEAARSFGHCGRII